MFVRSRAILAAVLLAGAAPAAGAQSVITPAEPTVAAGAAGPTVDATASAVRAQRDAIAREDALRSARAQGSLSRGAVLMIVGGAALITGAVIGDDAGTIIMVGGALVGLYGLYLWLPSQR